MITSKTQPSLRQQGTVDEYVSKFQKIAVMIHHIPQERLTFLFIEEMMESLHGMVKVSSPRILDDAIQAAYDLQLTMKSLKGGYMYKQLATQKTFANKEGPSKAKPFPPPRTNQLDVATRRKLREEGKYFYCKKTWEPRHRC